MKYAVPKDHILAVSDNLSQDYLLPFIASLREVGQLGTLTLFTPLAPYLIPDWLQRSGVRILRYDHLRVKLGPRHCNGWEPPLSILRHLFRPGSPPVPICPLRHWRRLASRLFSPKYSRYFAYRDFVYRECGPADRIFICDIRDVWFQSDPFSEAWPRSLMVAEEHRDHLLGRYARYRKMLPNIFVDISLEDLWEHPMLCSGTTWGHTREIEDYLMRMEWLILRYYIRHPLRLSGDQIYHNMVCRRFPPDKITVVPYDNGLVYTMAMAIRNDRVTFSRLPVRFPSGHEPPVLHQYDRRPSLRNHIHELTRRLAPDLMGD